MIYPYIYAFLFGSLLPLGYAPFYWIPLIYLGLIGFYCLIYQTPPKLAFYLGFVFGLGYFGVGVSWVYVSIHDYGGNSLWLSSLITLAFIMVLSLFPAFMAFFLQWLTPIRPSLRSIATIASAWTLFEWLRSFIFTGFPWLLLGYSQTDTLLKNFASMIGVYGLSFTILFCGGLTVLTILYMRKKTLLSLLYLSMLFIIGITAYSLKHTTWTQAHTKPISVALVQGNISQTLKWSKPYFLDTIQTYVELSKPHWGVDILVWPESAIPSPNIYVQSLLDELDQKGKKHGTTFITGILEIVDESKNDTLYYNSIFALGEGNGIYRKVHLVPFGEFIPLKSWFQSMIESLGFFMTDFTSGATDQPPIFAQSISIAPFICYEIAYSSALRSQQRMNSHLMLTISNDGWFGNSLAPHQHLQIARMRSLEMERYQLVTTNDGITAIIKPDGSLASIAPSFQDIVLKGDVYAHEGLTPWAIIGNSPLLLLSLMIWLGTFLSYRWPFK